MSSGQFIKGNVSTGGTGGTGSSFSGDYNDLTNKPTIPSTPLKAVPAEVTATSTDDSKFLTPASLAGTISIVSSLRNDAVIGDGTITNIVGLTQAAYNALATKDPTTHYIITS